MAGHPRAVRPKLWEGLQWRAGQDLPQQTTPTEVVLWFPWVRGDNVEADSPRLNVPMLESDSTLTPSWPNASVEVYA